jgi:N-acetylglucosamine-6-sulfatase
MQKIDGLPPLGPATVSSDRSIKDRLRMLAAVDESTGAIVDALRETGRLDAALIVFTSDHGYFYGEHGLSTERRLAYEESIRIPLIMWSPKLIKKPRVVGDTVMSLDMAPTFLELAGAERPAKLRGLSLVPLLGGASEMFPRNRDVLIEYYSDTVFPRMRKMGYTALRTDRWKYIHYTDQPAGSEELYDLASDPYELKNLAAEPSSVEKLALMKRRLREVSEAAAR